MRKARVWYAQPGLPGDSRVKESVVNELKLTHLVVLLVAAALLASCGHVNMQPWRQAQAAPAAPVNELVVKRNAGADAAADGAADGMVSSLSQTWDRNTLRVALNSVAGAGELKLRPISGHGWPIRLEFAVQPGAFAHLELRGEQRVVLSVPASGNPVVLSVPQGIYAPTTAELTLRYGP